LSVLDKVRADMTSAMRSGEKQLVGALRLVIAELQRDAKEGSGDELAVLRREHKRRLEAASQFRDGGRPELAVQEEAEARMIAEYLPPDLGDADLARIVADAIDQTGASGPGDMGRVMKVVVSAADGRVDGRRASDAVRAALAARTM
jgi:hypothetical protein